MLLAEGLSIKVLLLPDGEDPDSYARTHSASEFKQYINDNETDFISFKTKILLEGTERDPIKRAAVIGDVVKSISVVPDAIARSVYARECSIQLGISEDVLLREIQKNIKLNQEEAFKRKQRESNRAARQQALQGKQSDAITSPEQLTPPPPAIDVPPPVGDETLGDSEPPVIDAPPTLEDVPPLVTDAPPADAATTSPGIDPSALTSLQASKEALLYPAELGVMRNVVKYGMCYLCATIDEKGEPRPTSVLEFTYNELALDSITFSVKAFEMTFSASVEYINEFYTALAERESQEHTLAQAQFKKAIGTIDTNGLNVAAIEKKEQELLSGINKEMEVRINEFRKNYLEKKLCSHFSDEVRSTALQLVSEKHQLSKIYSMENIEHSIESRLNTIVPEAIMNLKNAIISCQILDTQQQLKFAHGSEAKDLLLQLQQLFETRKEIARFIGERVVNPRIRH